MMPTRAKTSGAEHQGLVTVRVQVLACWGQSKVRFRGNQKKHWYWWQRKDILVQVSSVLA